MDDAVEKVISKLKSLNIYDNTIIVFTSDNGGLIGGKNTITNNYPLRPEKGDMYEGGVRIPLIIKPIDENTIGKVSTSIISNDFLPTLMEMSEIPVSSSIKESWDGEDFSILLTGGNNDLQRDAIYWHYPHYHIGEAVPYSAIRKGNWKLIHNIGSKDYELYDLKNDISESKNLVEDFPVVANELTKELEAWRFQVKTQMPSLNPNLIQPKR